MTKKQAKTKIKTGVHLNSLNIIFKNKGSCCLGKLRYIKDFQKSHGN